MTASIPLLVPDMPTAEDILPFLREMDRSRWYTNFGPLSRRFETALSNALGVDPVGVVTVANCTLGLEVALAALQLKPGSRVLVPALTFAATATAVMRAGLHPVLSDVDQRNWLLTPSIARAEAARQALGCVIPVTAFGCPQPTGGWDSFRSDTGIPVLIDAAGAFGNQPIGDSTAAVFSFHATKAFGIGEGGLLAVRDHQFIARVRKLVNFGIDTSTGLAMLPGTNAKMSEYHAAVGLAALRRWPERSVRRKSLFTSYVTQLRDRCPTIRFQERPDEGIYTIMQVLLPDSCNRAEVAKYLAAQGIETRPWYLPLLDSHPAFSMFSMADGLCAARALAPRLLGLPFHLDLDDAAIRRISSVLARALGTSD